MARNTSYEVKRRYEKKAGYGMHNIRLKKDLVARFRAFCDVTGDSYNSILVDGIKQYIFDNDK